MRSGRPRLKSAIPSLLLARFQQRYIPMGLTKNTIPAAEMFYTSVIDSYPTWCIHDLRSTSPNCRTQ